MQGRVIGLTGYAGSGKDALANFLAHDYGYAKVSFADPIRNLALALNPWVLIYGFMPVKLTWIVWRLGWDRAKKHKRIRRLLQDLGMKCRLNISDQVFIDAARHTIDGYTSHGVNVVVPDVRFENECEFILSERGTILLIDRGLKPVNDHVSDSGQAFKFARHVIQNNGGLDRLRSISDSLHNAVNLMQQPRLQLHIEEEEPEVTSAFEGQE